ncbi:NAD(P)H-dependent oxidoreductase [Oceanobacillus caeni]|uniref:NAD(P)H-dependent oxidoreductase n=1 Tax=Oceanobacillus caeni TaxID=405946 RepID=UPI0006216C04|nr:NAD(P)H-dependent oxidoreductase [Oceanobacillus caeni]KKE79425.1 NADPH-dependent FMN reductase [Bacilli bacterium VT-13-104]PZD88280.1 NADPH-dependent oxidoreductase [Bacilli bacterium]MCR1834033.1 NAD(P)H-dependent oxidoreductase [Oceanobacillus caeni]PZD90375.1 NADPH-dependent oxidoreductase [Bacilli bacterium]PZD92161.1 NADPH-dependent oxidoreductase [Bacilli bacterium]
MKIVGIVGSNADFSYNRLLLNFIAKQFKTLVDVEVLDIKDIPMFNQSDDQTNSAPIQHFNKKITEADGVIIATPEYNHSVPSALQSVIEWLSFKIHPLDGKPVMIVGASYDIQGSSRSQLHLRQILDAPGVNAVVMPGNEFLLGEVHKAFDEDKNLKDPQTTQFLESCIKKFIRFINVVNVLNSPEGMKDVSSTEDLYATGSIDTTIEGIDMSADDWVEQAAKATKAVEGNTYVKLNRGILTVNQLNHFLNSMPAELTYADSNNQFLYYNHKLDAEDMLATRRPGQVGNPLAECHPERAFSSVAWVIQQLRNGKQDVVRTHVPTHGPDKYVVHSYQAIRDEDGNYLGINEYVQDIKPMIDWYLEQTGQQLTGGNVDAVSGATTKVDTVSSATVKG